MSELILRDPTLMTESICLPSGDRLSPSPVTSPYSTTVLLDTKSTLEELRRRCPLPELMRRMGLERFAKPSCLSPFRKEEKPSWGIFQREGRWFWKDHGTSESGDEIDFIARAKKYTGPGAFPKALEYWEAQSRKAATLHLEEVPACTPRLKPDVTPFGAGSEEQLNRLAKLRKIDSRGLLMAQERGLLVFGTFIGHPVFGIKDSSGNVLELRRLDGEPFPAHSELTERKSHAVKGSVKTWPVGIADIGTRAKILLVEGLPDFLAAFEVIVSEGELERVAPVAMLAATVSIASDALPMFKGRHIRIIPHADKAGREGAIRWKRQLIEAGAAKVDFYELASEAEEGSTPIKDLNDYLPIYRMETADGSTEGRIL